MTTGSSFADRLKQARKRAGLSQRALGIAAGVDEFGAGPRVNQWERGKHIPAPQVQARIAEALNLPAAYFHATDDELAELISSYWSLTRVDRLRAIKAIRRLGGNEEIDVPLQGIATHKKRATPARSK